MKIAILRRSSPPDTATVEEVRVVLVGAAAVRRHGRWSKRLASPDELRLLCAAHRPESTPA